MKKYISALLCCALLLFSTSTAQAASPTLGINYGNKYTVTLGGGTYSYTVPFTANYELTLSGTRGAAYSNNSGGYGYTLSQTVRLNKGDEIKVELPNAPGYYQSGNTVVVPGGNPGKLWINGNLYWVAAGGQGKISNGIAPNNATAIQVYNGNGTSNGAANTYDVHWHSGNGLSGPYHSNSFPTLSTYNNPGGCYIGSHVCDENCRRTCGTQLVKVSEHDYRDGCAWHGHGNFTACQYACYSCGDPDENYVVMRFEWQHESDRPQGPFYCIEIIGACTGLLNKWDLGCGTQQGQILGYNGAERAGSCLATGNPSASLTSSGNASFTIKLSETENTQYLNTTVRKGNLYYLNSYADLVLIDDIVCYYKRR